MSRSSRSGATLSGAFSVSMLSVAALSLATPARAAAAPSTAAPAAPGAPSAAAPTATPPAEPAAAPPPAASPKPAAPGPTAPAASTPPPDMGPDDESPQASSPAAGDESSAALAPEGAGAGGEAAAGPGEPSPALQFIQSQKRTPETPAAEATPDDGLMGSHQEHLIGVLGVRFGFIPGSGYDPFSDDNALTQSSLGVGRTVYALEDLSFAALALWDWGESNATARGADTSISVHRLSIGLEGRYHFLRRLFAFARIAPGALHWDATLRDGGAGVDRMDSSWAFSTDLSAGAAFEFAGEPRGISNLPRGFVVADGGYGWSGASSLSFEPESAETGPARLEPLDLGEVALRGGFFRVAAMVTY